MRCCSLKMLEKNVRDSAQLLYLYSQFPNWLIHFQELESILGTKFLQKGLGPSTDSRAAHRSTPNNRDQAAF